VCVCVYVCVCVCICMCMCMCMCVYVWLSARERVCMRMRVKMLSPRVTLSGGACFKASCSSRFNRLRSMCNIRCVCVCATPAPNVCALYQIFVGL
jgi:hypothetical protein